jgi:hypothetical protein
MAGAIEWVEGGVDAAQELARSAGRPMFLYWGAVWCPPCNRVKSEIFARDEFVSATRSLVCVQVDGDTPGAQLLAARLKLRSYPTLVLYRPDGTEITRLPCELDGEQFTEALVAARFAGFTAAESLDAALDGTRMLAAAEWTLLSNYSWDTDEGVLLGARELVATLVQLANLATAATADEAPAAATQIANASDRLRLHALVAQAGRATDPGAAGFLLRVFRNAPLARSNMDIFVNSGHLLLRAATAQQAELATALARAAQAWSDDMWISAPDRLMAARLQMRMARMGYAAEGLPALVRSRVDAALAETDDAYARHTLVNTAVSALNDAGLHADAEALLQAEAPRAHSPYYFMLSLAASAKRRGDVAGMLSCYEQAWRSATGPATRIQWATTYLSAVIDATPADSSRIETAAAAIADDFHAAGGDAFAQRNLTQASKLQAKLEALPSRGAAADALRSLLTRR